MTKMNVQKLIRTMRLKTDLLSIRLHGPIISLQFSDNGNASWIVSGRWRADISYDVNGVMSRHHL